MKTFDNIQDFSNFLSNLAVKYEKYEIKAATFALEVLEFEAKDKIGHLQSGGGEFKSWEPLAESTLADKERNGYIFNADGNPLYREGDLRESIRSSYHPNLRKGYLGSTSMIGLYQEMGTNRIPPRSFIGLTMYQGGHLVASIMGQAMVQWLSSTRLNLRVQGHHAQKSEDI